MSKYKKLSDEIKSFNEGNPASEKLADEYMAFIKDPAVPDWAKKQIRTIIRQPDHAEAAKWVEKIHNLINQPGNVSPQVVQAINAPDSVPSTSNPPAEKPTVGRSRNVPDTMDFASAGTPVTNVANKNVFGDFDDLEDQNKPKWVQSAITEIQRTIDDSVAEAKHLAAKKGKPPKTINAMINAQKRAMGWCAHWAKALRDGEGFNPQGIAGFLATASDHDHNAIPGWIKNIARATEKQSIQSDADREAIAAEMDWLKHRIQTIEPTQP